MPQSFHQVLLAPLTELGATDLDTTEAVLRMFDWMLINRQVGNGQLRPIAAPRPGLSHHQARVSMNGRRQTAKTCQPVPYRGEAHLA
jgi:hypothetical protein